MKILIRGAGFQNKGAEAMLRVVQRELGMRIPEASFYATVPPLDAPFANRSGVSPVVIPRSTRTKILRTLPIVSKIRETLISLRNPFFSKAIKSSKKTAFEIEDMGHVDAVVDISGFSYGDAWQVSRLKDAWAWVEYCKLKKKPYIFFPQAWGAFEKEKVSFWAEKICRNAALFFSRDNESTNYLSSLLNVSTTEVRTAPDIAFCFRGAPDAAGCAVLHNLGLDKKARPLVALVPNMRVYQRTVGVGASNEYVKHLISLANYCIEHLGANLLLIPNEIYAPGAKGADDRFLCGVIESRIRKPEHCFAIREYLPSETVKSVIGQADFLIASRFHSLVFALSQGIPVLALGWSHKYRELLQAFGLGCFVVEHNQLKTRDVFSLVNKAWGQREVSKGQVLDAIPTMQRKVEALFDEVASVICGADS